MPMHIPFDHVCELAVQSVEPRGIGEPRRHAPVTIARSEQIVRRGSEGLVAQWQGCGDRLRAFWGCRRRVSPSGGLRARKGSCGDQSRPLGEEAGGGNEPSARRARARRTGHRAQPAAERQSPAGDRADWRSRYALRLWLSDLAALIIVVFGTQIAWFGLGNAQVSIREDSRLSVVSYWFFSALLVVAWMWSLSLIDSRSDRAIGTGSTEYIRIISVSVRLFGIIAILAFLLRVDVARGYLLIAFPLGVLFLLLERWLWRQWLVVKRARGEFSAARPAGRLRELRRADRDALRRTPSAGYQRRRRLRAAHRAGRHTCGGTDIPIVGSVLSISEALATVDADTVAISSTDELPPSVVKRISWQLEAGRQHLVLAPSIIDVVGPRIQTRPVAGLPLIHVETPRYSKGQRLAKRGLDLLPAIGRHHRAQPGDGGHRDRHPLEAKRPGLVPPGARRARRTRVPDAQVPHDGARTPRICCPTSSPAAMPATRCSSR